MKYLVIPTYNEKDNISELLAAIYALHISDLHVLIVDDGSPDGTGQIIEGLRSTYPTLEIMHRTGKQGLGKAYVAGFTYALEHDAELILQMDADWSHDPQYLPTLIEKSQSYDVVLGSRYVAGGGTRNWDATRRFISRFGNWYARTILHVPYRDLTGGLKCYRASALQKIHLETLSSVGYNFQIETTYKAHHAGCRIAEVPIIFTERKTGSSKFSLAITIESFWKVLQLRFKKV